MTLNLEDDQGVPKWGSQPTDLCAGPQPDQFADIPWVRWLDEDPAYELGLRPFARSTGTPLLPFERTRLLDGAKNGDAKALLQIACLFAQNAEHETDPVNAQHLHRRANEWLEKAGAGNLAEALFMLGKRHQAGHGVVANPAAAASYFEQAAALGHTSAIYDLGRCYLRGEGVPLDPERGAALLSQAADHSHADAGYELGRCYYNGVGVTVNKWNADRLLSWAASRGHVNARCAVELWEKSPSEEYTAVWWAYDPKEPQKKCLTYPTAPSESQSQKEHGLSDGEKRRRNVDRWCWLIALPMWGAVIAYGIHDTWSAFPLPPLWAIVALGCISGPVVAWLTGRKTTSREADDRIRRAQEAQNDLRSIRAKGFDMIDDGINLCIFHAACVAMAFALSWIFWVFGTGHLATSDVLWGAHHPEVIAKTVHGNSVEEYERPPYDDQGHWIGIVRYVVYQLTGFEDPWFCCFLVGVATTCAIGLLRVPIGFLDAIEEGHTTTAKEMVLGTKTISSALHLAGFGLNMGITAIENLLGSPPGAGESAAMAALAGWPYLRRTATMYQTPVRYVLNLAYGGAIFALVFPLASHGVLGSIQAISGNEWGWLIWYLVFAILGLPLLLLYLQAAWYQGYGIGLWLGSWVPPYGWKLRCIYRTPPSVCLFHHDVVRTAVGLEDE